MGMVVNGLDLVDFGQQLGIGGLGEQRGSQKKTDKRDSGSHKHVKSVLRACARRLNLGARDCKISDASGFSRGSGSRMGRNVWKFLKLEDGTYAVYHKGN